MIVRKVDMFTTPYIVIYFELYGNIMYGIVIII